MEEKKQMTIGDLATLMQAGFELLDHKIDAAQAETKAEVKQLEARMDRHFEELKERTFTSLEKDELLATAAATNEFLEQGARGEKNITLTRPEYDSTATGVGFVNRFTAPALAE